MTCSLDPGCPLPDGHDGLCKLTAFGEREAWRAWKVIGPPANPRLYSQYGHLHQEGKLFAKGSIWPPDEWFAARCPHAPKDPAEQVAYYANHPTPVSPGCTCGIYAAVSREHLHQVGSYHAYTRDNLAVMGRVGLAGKVIECETGYRAQKARLLELFVPAARWDYAAGLGDVYGVPVVLDNTWESIVSDHGTRIGG